jgi:hypothetical protein
LAANTSGGSVTFNNTSANLTVGTVNGTSGIATSNQNLTLTTTTSGSIAVNQAVSTGTGTVNLSSAGAITQTANLSGSTLTTSSATGTTLNAANTVSVFTATNTTSGNIALTNTAAPLTIPLGGISEVAGGTVSVENTGAIVLTGPVSAGSGGTITLDTLGTGTLTASAAGAGLLTADTINLQTTSASSGAVGTSAAVPVNVAGGSGTATVHLGQSSSLAGAYLLNSTNAITLASVSLAANAPLNVVASNTASGLLTLPAAPISTGTSQMYLSSGTSLTVPAGGALSSSSGTISLLANNGALAVNAAVGASSGTVNLTATGAITQTAPLTGVTLVAQTWNNAGSAITLNNAGNHFSAASSAVSLWSLDGTHAITEPGNLTYVDSGAFVLGTVKTTGWASLTSGGAVTQTGALTLGTGASGGLELSGTGPYTLTNAANAITNVAGNVTGGGVNLSDSTSLNVTTVNATTGLVASGSIQLTSSGTLALAQAVSSTAGNVSLDGTIAVTSVSTGTVTTSGGTIDFGATGTGPASLAGNVTSGSAGISGGAITFHRAVTMASSITIDTGSKTPAAVTFANTLDNASPNAANLTVANASTLTFSGAVGSSANKLGTAAGGSAAVTATAGSVIFSSTVATVGALAVTGNTTFDASAVIGASSATDTFTGNVTLNSAAAISYASGNPVSITGNLALSGGGSATIDTSANKTNVSVGGTVNGPVGGQNLTVTTGLTGSGNITLGGNVGNQVANLFLQGNVLTLGNGTAISVSSTGVGTGSPITFNVDGLVQNPAGATVNAGTAAFIMYPRSTSASIEISQTSEALAPIWYQSSFAGVTAGSITVGSSTSTGNFFVGNKNATSVVYPLQTLTSGTTRIGNWTSSGKSLSINNATTSGLVQMGISSGAGPSVSLGSGAFAEYGATTILSNQATALTANGGVTFNGTIDGSGGSESLTVNATAAKTFVGGVGAGTPLGGAFTSSGTPGTTSTVLQGGTLSAKGGITINDQTAIQTTALTMSTLNNPIALNDNVIGNSQNLIIGASTGSGAFTVASGKTVTGLGSGAGAAFTVSSGVTGLVKFGGTVVAANGFNVQGTGSNVEFDDNVTISGASTASTFAGTGASSVSFKKSGASPQVFSTAGSATFSGTVDLTGTNDLVDLTTTGNAAYGLNFNTATSNLKVGSGGATLTGNVNFTGGTLTGWAGPGADDITFSTVGTTTTVTFGTFTNNGNTNTNGNRLVFNANQSISLNPNGQTFQNILVGNGSPTAVTMSNGLVNLAASASFTVASGSSFLMSTTAPYAGIHYGLQLGALASVVNNGTFAANNPGALGNSQILIWGIGASPATLTNNNALAGTFVFTGVSPNVADVSIENVTVNSGGTAPTVTIPAGSNLYIDDSNCQLVNVTNNGNVVFNGLVNTATSHNLAVSGSWDDTSGTLTGLGVGTPSVVTFNTQASGATLNTGGTGNGSKNFYNVVLSGTGTLTLNGSLGLNGYLDQTGTGGFVFTNQSLLVEGALTLTSATTTGSTVYLVPIAANTAISCTPALNDLVVNANGGSIQQSTDLTVHRFMAFKGAWNTNGFNLTTTEDFVAYGAGYVQYAIAGAPGTPFNPSDDGELAATRTGAYITDLLGYPYFGNGGASVVAMHTALNSAFGLTLYAGARTDVPAANAQTASFTMSAGKALNVGRNFYDFGVSMTAGGAWNLNLPAKWTSGTSAYNPAVTWTGINLNQNKTNTATPTDWFGLPFAVALSTTAGMSITNSTSSQPIAAAQTSVAGTFTAGTGVASPVWTSAVGLDAYSLAHGWDNTRPDIDTKTTNQTITRFDNLVEVHFDKPMLDVGGEANFAVNSPTALDDLRFGTGGTSAAFKTASVVVPSYAVTSPIANANSSVIGFISGGTTTWNTDATGASSGGASSTDRSGNHQIFIPVLTLEKGRLYDTSGNPIVNRDGVNYNGTALSTTYTGTTDGARPVLIKVLIGQQTHPANPASYASDDSHNYYKLLWSEPVNLTSINPALTVGSSNVAATLTFGDAYGNGTVNVAGLFSYAGSLYRSTRSWENANGNADPSSNQNQATQVCDALGRTTSQDLIVSVAGLSTGSGASTSWDGFIWNTTVPALNFVVAANVGIVDAQGNPVENSSVNYASPATAGVDPKTVFTFQNDITANESSGISSNGGTVPVVYSGRLNASLNPVTPWEVDPPVFAPYSTAGGAPYYEIVPLDLASDGIVHTFQFHVLSDTVNQPGPNNTAASWNSTSPAQPDTTLGHFGLRDDSLANIAKGFMFKAAADSSYSSAYNLAPTGGTPWAGSTSVQNTLFTPGALPGSVASADSTQDDGYFTLSINTATEPLTWKPTAQFAVQYNQFAGMLTNLAGVLLSSKTSNFDAIDRTPPSIVLTLAEQGQTRVYVQFNRMVQGFGTAPNYADVLTLSGGSGTNSIQKLTPISGTVAGGFQEAFVDLAQPLSADDLLSVKIRANTTSSIVAATNPMDNTILYPISNLAINMVQPIWASDGTGGSANQTGTAHVIYDFTGAEYLTSNDIDLQAKVFGTVGPSLPIRLFFDHRDDTRDTNNIWLPSGLFNLTPANGVQYTVLPLSGDTAVRWVDPYAVDSTGTLKNFRLPGTDSDIASGATIQFMFRLGSLYAVQGTNPQDPRQLSLWEIPFKTVKTQKNGVTVLNNVINPTEGQETEILYTMKRSGIATIQVFDLDGNLIKVLHRGRQSAGNYTLYWDGTNAGGRPVARGVYFIRVVAPDTDETRNVLIIK